MSLEEMKTMCFDYARQQGVMLDPILQLRLEEFAEDHATMGTDPSDALLLLSQKFRHWTGNSLFQESPSLGG
jgi:hypothetical protein